MKKRILSILLTVTMLLSMCPFTALAAEGTASGTCGENLTWTLDHGVLTISGSGDMSWQGEVPWNAYQSEIQSVVVEAGVTSIDSYAFAYCDSLTSVSLPEGLTMIESGAFEGTPLQEIDIPSGVRSLGMSCFAYCYALKRVSLPDGLQEIGKEAFMLTSLEELEVPASVWRFGQACFPEITTTTIVGYTGSYAQIATTGYNFRSLGTATTTIRCGDNLTATIQDHVMTISGTGAMYDYSADAGIEWDLYDVSTIEIENGVTSIGAYAFEYCDVSKVTLPETLTQIGEGAFGRCTALTSIAIPENVVSIGGSAFEYCRSLTSVSLPDNLTHIGDWAFSSCDSLSSINLPKHLTQISEGMLDYCPSLTSITIPDSVTSIGDWAFSLCTSLTSVVVPNRVTSLGDDVFHSCENLQSVTLPDGITSLSARLFAECSSLTSITIPSSVTGIGYGTFNGCSSLTSVVIPQNVTSIEGYAFARCSSLSGVVIPSGVTSIGRNAFYSCEKLHDITMLATDTEIGEQALGYVNGDWGAEKLSNFIINGFAGSSAEAYATENGFEFSPITVVSVESASKIFTDVPEDIYYTNPVTWAVAAGVTTGATATTFNPGGSCTREQVVTFLWRAAGEPEPSTTENPFTDVKAGYSYKAILWAVEQGITTGATATTFKPKGTCTREQVVTFLWRFAGNPEPTTTENPFTDVKAGYSYQAVLWAVEQGITTGTTATTFSPKATCTRAQVVTFLFRDLVEVYD